MAARENQSPAKKNNSLRNFGGVNTQAARQVIGDDQFAWLENVMPVGFGNMPAIPGPSQSLVSFPAAVYHMRSVNIGGIDYEIGFGTNGAVYAINLTTFALTTIAAAGTLSAAGAELAQWENSQAIIVDPTNGYFSWDGTTFTKQNGTVQSLTVTTIGTGYTTAPTLAFSGGGGSGAAATTFIQAGLVTLTAGGTGYNVGDTVWIAGGSTSDPTKLEVSAIGTGGVITGINLTDAGSYTAAPANPASSTSLYGVGATFTVNFGVGPVTLTTDGTGYTSAPTVTLTGGGGTGAVVTATLAVVPSGGTAVATYAGRVWVAANRTVVFSAPGSFTDYSSEGGGGSFIVTDETRHSSIISLLSANNFLYIAGTSSFNVVGDVNVSNGVTVFSNTNISASIGTSQPYSVIPYYRAVWFAAPYGIYALYGSTTQKTSDDLDGIFPLIASGIPFSAATAVIKNILTLCFMFRYNDPVRGARTLFAIYFNKKWFFASQGDTLTLVDTAIINGLPTVFATDGTRFYKIFSDSTISVAQTIVTKLWDMGDPLANKQSIKFGLEVINPLSPQTITGTIDTETDGGAISINLQNGNTQQWVNNSGQFVQWENTSGTIVFWVSSGYAFIPLDVQTVGRYLGVTLSGTSAGTIYAGLHLQYEMRTPWAEGGPQ